MSPPVSLSYIAFGLVSLATFFSINYVVPEPYMVRPDKELTCNVGAVNSPPGRLAGRTRSSIFPRPNSIAGATSPPGTPSSPRLQACECRLPAKYRMVLRSDDMRIPLPLVVVPMTATFSLYFQPNSFAFPATRCHHIERRISSFSSLSRSSFGHSSPARPRRRAGSSPRRRLGTSWRP